MHLTLQPAPIISSAQIFVPCSLISAPPSAVLGQLGTRQQFEVLAAAPATIGEPPGEGTEAAAAATAAAPEQPQNEIAYLWRQVMRLSYAKQWVKGVHD